MKRFTWNSQGFTLVEIIVAFAVISLLSVMVMSISIQMISFSAMLQGRSAALSLAQDKIEEMRSSLVIPSYFEDEPRYGYLRTITSTIVTESTTATTAQIIRFLRHVTVSVQTPSNAGGGSYSLETDIQTYRPQVVFQFPVVGESFVRSGVETLLEGNLRDDGYNIDKSNIYCRKREYSGGSWGDWSTWLPFASSGGHVWSDIDHTIPAPQILVLGTPYYFTFPVTPNRPDGQWVEIQFSAINDASVQCEQPLSPQGGTSYIQLAVDSTSPEISYFTSSPSDLVGPSTPLEGVFLATQDPPGGGVASDVYVSYLTLNKVTTPTQYWGIDPSSALPEWVTSTPSPYYWPMTFTSSDSFWQWSTSDMNPFTGDPPGTQYQMRGYVLDKVIGRTSAFQKSIPVQGSPFGVGGHAWPDVNANYVQSPTRALQIASLPVVASYTPTPVISWGEYSGEFGVSPTTFSSPGSVAVSGDGIVYVADRGDSTYPLKTFTMTGYSLGAWETSGNGLISQAAAVTVDGVGNVYVLDSGDKRVQKYGPSGTFIYSWDALMSNPLGIAVSWDGSVYVVGQNNGTGSMRKFNALGVPQTSFQPPALLDPRGITVDPWGFLYVTDYSSAHIRKLNCDGTVLATWSAATPVGISSDRQGNIFVVNQQSKAIQKFSNQGSYITSWSVASVDKYPEGVAVSQNGIVVLTSMYVQPGERKFIQCFNPQ
jgi:prepilin-type N-terminal cleavage/methylation domain-containing protein